MRNKNIIFSGLVAFALSFGAIGTSAIAGETSVAAETSETLYSGEWTKKAFNSSGIWEIYAENGTTFVKLSSEFKTRKAPDLKIFLSPLTAADTTGKNATDGSLLIAPLTSNQGEQVYEIPERVDLAAYKSIILHCEDYSKLWSAADL